MLKLSSYSNFGIFAHISVFSFDSSQVWADVDILQLTIVDKIMATTTTDTSAIYFHWIDFNHLVIKKKEDPSFIIWNDNEIRIFWFYEPSITDVFLKTALKTPVLFQSTSWVIDELLKLQTKEEIKVLPKHTEGRGRKTETDSNLTYYFP